MKWKTDWGFRLRVVQYRATTIDLWIVISFIRIPPNISIFWTSRITIFVIGRMEVVPKSESSYIVNDLLYFDEFCI